MVTESYRYIDEQLDYWATVFARLGLAGAGIRYEHFVGGPCRNLPLVGTGSPQTLATMPALGTA